MATLHGALGARSKDLIGLVGHRSLRCQCKVNEATHDKASEGVLGEIARGKASEDALGEVAHGGQARLHQMR